MTRVLVVTNLYPPHHYGGYELSCQDVVERLRGRGHVVDILTTQTRLPGVDDAPSEADGSVARALEWYWRDHVLLKPSLPRRLAIERANQARLRAAVERTRPDVVSLWHMGGLSLGLITTLDEMQLPLVFSVCDEWPVYGPLMDRWTRLFLDRPRLGRAVRRITGLPTSLPDLARTGAWCFVSRFLLDQVEERGRWRFDTSTVVYSGIDRRDFPGGPSAARPSWAWRLLYVGRVDKRKGIETLLRALARLPEEAHLTVLGPGEEAYKARVLALVRDLGLAERVRFDAVPRAMLADHYRSCDAFVFPSEWDEPFGLVPVEAMACGVPVVATGTGGSAEFLVDGENCVRFRPADVDGLVAALHRLSDDPALRRRVTEGGIGTADELDVERLADAFEAWHQAAADGFTAGRPPERVLAVRDVAG